MMTIGKALNFLKQIALTKGKNLDVNGYIDPLVNLTDFEINEEQLSIALKILHADLDILQELLDNLSDEEYNKILKQEWAKLN